MKKNENISEEELYFEIKKAIPRNKHFQSLPVHMREDVVMTTYEKSLKKLRDGTITGQWEDGLKHYVFLIGLNETREQLNKLNIKNRAFTRPIDNNNELISLDELAWVDTEDDADYLDVYNIIIGGIDDKELSEIFQYRLEGYTFKEIGAMMNVPRKTVDGKYRVAVKNLLKNNPDEIINSVKRIKTEKKRYELRKVINVDTNEIFETIALAARANDIKYNTLVSMLNETRTNKTKLRNYDPSNYKKD